MQIHSIMPAVHTAEHTSN